MTAPHEILELVARFDGNRDAYRSAQYNETRLRREFLDPFFGALGWDLDNKQGYAEAYKDVIHEDAIKIGASTKAPDYCFRIGGARKFFVEAKKPAVDIKQDATPAFQLRRYAWSAKLPLSILTDFEEFAVYDCRIKPAIADKSSAGRIQYLTYAEYAEKWEEIRSVFSKDSVLKGSFDKYAETTRSRKGTAEVDAAFLKDIETWRDLLARNLAVRNPRLTQRELNFAVQRTIDRIIFLRICEDRGIERELRLLGITNGNGVYDRLRQLYREADERYNSGLFHFREEKDRAEDVDRLTPHLTVDDKVLREIIKNLYPPDSPYEFSVLPADILGQVYEQFLGKVIRLTAGHQAKVEDKPEVKKAGGVFYTPTYIVEYIVRNTVDRLLEGKTPTEVARLKILDPACGSGSFLIVAYQHLLDWHREWYVSNGKEKWAKGKEPSLYQGQGGEWRLTTNRRKEILLNNIYGVDIDPQAVEVTKLSLLLKVLEGESEQTLKSSFFLFHKRALPDLGNNIQCGNSLIGSDFYRDQQLGFFDDEERLRINVFDWEKEFPQVFGGPNPGFDAVIGNPPYIRIQALKEWAPLEVEFYKNRYVSASKGNYDIYVVFVEKGLGLLNGKGRLGFILPHKFFNAQYGEPLRGLISRGKHLADVVHFGDNQVFTGATTYTCLMFLEKAGAAECKYVKVDNLAEWCKQEPREKALLPSHNISSYGWNFIEGRGASLYQKLVRMPTKLGGIADIFVGLQTSADKIYVLTLVKERDTQILVQSRALEDERITFESSLLHPLLKGSEISRYQDIQYKHVLIFPYRIESGKAVPLTEVEMSSYPKTFTYLTRNKASIMKCKKTYLNNWWLYPYPKNLALFNRPKILSQVLSTRGNFALDMEGKFYLLGGGTAGGYSIHIKDEDPSMLKFVLGILNAQLTTYFVSQVASGFRGGFFAFGKSSLKDFPIPTINFFDRSNKTKYDRMVKLVEQMLALHKQSAAAKTDHEKTALQRQIDTTDRQIDQLVYELYGLTDDEIRIVENR